MEKREQFNNAVQGLMEKKNFNGTYFCREKYNQIVDFLKSEGDKPGKTPKEFRWLNRFQLYNDQRFMKIGGKKMACAEEFYDIIHDSHIRNGHAGRDILLKYINEDYENITRECVELYLKLCKECLLKKGKVRKGIVVKPILSSEMNSRCQVDLIDMQSQADEDNKFILVYQVRIFIVSP